MIVLHDIAAVTELQRAKDEMIGMVSHELRTPQTRIVGVTELLIDRSFSAAHQKIQARQASLSTQGIDRCCPARATARARK